MTTNHAEKTAARTRAEREGVRYTTALARERALRHPRVASHPGPDGLLRHDLGHDALASYLPLLDLVPAPWSLRVGANGYGLLVRDLGERGDYDAAVGFVSTAEWSAEVEAAVGEGAPAPTAEDFLEGPWTVPLEDRLDEAEFLVAAVLGSVHEAPRSDLPPLPDPPFGEVLRDGGSPDVVVVRNRRDGALARELAAVLASLPRVSAP